MAIFNIFASLGLAARLVVAQPNGEMMDRDVEIRVEELSPAQVIEIQVDADGVGSSRGVFQADESGCVDVGRDSPLEGSTYKGVDGMGLFWSMRPEGDFKCEEDWFVTDVKLVVEGEVVGRERVTRYFKASDVKRIEVRERGLVGVLFVPASTKPLPVIVTLSGSNGGISENRAKLLASNGFAVLALGYFRVGNLPSHLKEIPLEYFETAVEWLQERDDVDGSRVGLYGISRGAELSLLLGSVFPKLFGAIAAVAPSSVVYGGFEEEFYDAWFYQGKAVLPYASVPMVDFSDGKGSSVENPARVRQIFLEGMRDTATFEAAAIPVEKIACPILLVSGGDDEMWPSEIYAEKILERLRKEGSFVVCYHWHYPTAGHGIGPPNRPISPSVYFHPVAQRWFAMGGSREADARASRDSWNKIVAFFKEKL